MIISDELRYEIYIISLFHIIPYLILFSFSFYILLRAKKNDLLYSYLAVVSMILLWMFSKMMKTVSPNVSLRWFFILTQYIGVDFLGYFLILFAYVYRKNVFPSKKMMLLLGILPVASFLSILTNPLHMQFYSYYDFYRDSFGFLFYIVQFTHYVYITIGIFMLGKGFTKQQGFHGKQALGVTFAGITLIPIAANLYYILFKIDLVQWIFPFPVFDFTPIAGSLSLICFMLPALSFRFFEIPPVTYKKLYEITPQGIFFMNENNNLCKGNRLFYKIFDLEEQPGSFLTYQPTILSALVNNVISHQSHTFRLFLNTANKRESIHIEMKNHKVYDVLRKRLENGSFVLYFTEITQIKNNSIVLAEKNKELKLINQKLDQMKKRVTELSIEKAKASMAQTIHDILGHSLTVVIGTLELAASDNSLEDSMLKLNQAKNLLANSLCEINTAVLENEKKWENSSLIKAIEQLENNNIAIDFSTQGAVYELSPIKAEAIFRLCQEAVTNAIKHGQANTIYLILRYKSYAIEVFAMNNGRGCETIKKNYGLTGIENRFHELGGTVEYASDGESGFQIHAKLPR